MEYDPKDKKFPWKGDLWKYSYRGESKKIKKIIKKGGIQINEFDDCKNKMTSILIIPHTHPFCFCFLIVHRSALHYAAMGGDIETIKALIEGGAKIDSQHRYGAETPLQLALKHKHTDAAIVFVQLGANPAIENQWRKDSYALSKECGKRFELQFAEECKRYSSTRSTGATAAAPAAQKPAVPDLPAAPAIPKYMSASERVEAEKSGLPAAPVMDESVNDYAKKFGLEEEGGDVSGDANVTSQEGGPQGAAGVSGAGSKEVLYDRLRDQQKMFVVEPAEGSMTSQMTSSTTPAAKDVKKAASPTPASAALAEKARQNAMKKLGKEQSDRIRLLKRRIQRLELVNKSLAIWPTKLPQKGNAGNANASAAEARRLKKEAAAEEYRKMKMAAEKKENEVAVLMIKHLLGWFDPRIPPVTLAEWTPHIDVRKKYGSLDGGVSGSGSDGGSGGDSGTPGNMLTKWTRGLIELYIDSQEMSVQYIIKDCRKRVSGFASVVTDFDRACDVYIKELDECYPLAKEELKYLKKRVMDINQTCNGIGGTGRGADASPFQKAISTAVGSTYWIFNSLHRFNMDEMVAQTKKFVESLLSLGTKLDSEIETTMNCLSLANTVDGVTFFQKDPTVSKDISECLNALQATTRTLVMGVFQGGDRNSEYNTIIGTNLGKIKSIVSSTVSSRKKSSIHSHDEGEIAEKAVKYFISTIKFYKPFSTQPTIRDLLKELGNIPKMFVEFLRQYTIIRDTTVIEWSTFLKAGLDLANDLERFRTTFLSPEFDPDNMFKRCGEALEQCTQQLMIATLAIVFGNANCPRHEIAISVRALCFTLVSIMDLCYLNSN